MARPALEIDEDDALGLAPARAAAAGRLGRLGLQPQQRAERQAQHAGPAHAEHVAPRDPQSSIAKVLAGLSGYDEHDCLLQSALSLRERRTISSMVEEERGTVDQGPGQVLGERETRSFANCLRGMASVDVAARDVLSSLASGGEVGRRDRPASAGNDAANGRVDWNQLGIDGQRPGYVGRGARAFAAAAIRGLRRSNPWPGRPGAASSSQARPSAMLCFGGRWPPVGLLRGLALFDAVSETATTGVRAVLFLACCSQAAIRCGRVVSDSRRAASAAAIRCCRSRSRAATCGAICFS